MIKAKNGKLGKLAMSLVAALAIVGSAGVGLAVNSGETHAAIKWGEHDPSAFQPVVPGTPSLPDTASEHALYH